LVQAPGQTERKPTINKPTKKKWHRNKSCALIALMGERGRYTSYFVCMHMCVCTYELYVVCMYVCILYYIYVVICICVYISCVYIYIYIYIYIYTCMHIYVYMCMHIRVERRRGFGWAGEVGGGGQVGLCRRTQFTAPATASNSQLQSYRIFPDKILRIRGKRKICSM
jgi:hypothetical protein